MALFDPVEAQPTSYVIEILRRSQVGGGRGEGNGYQKFNL